MKDLQDVGIRHLLIGIMLIFSTNIVLAQKKVISGIITGTDNEPIINTDGVLSISMQERMFFNFI
jgi:hypothetical protein